MEGRVRPQANPAAASPSPAFHVPTRPHNSLALRSRTPVERNRLTPSNHERSIAPKVNRRRIEKPDQSDANP